MVALQPDCFELECEQRLEGAGMSLEFISEAV